MLVVDDEDYILRALEKYFETQNYKVDCARELEEAQALLTYIDYSIVIADLRLTGINGAEGLDIVRYIRERTSETRIILLTAYGSPEVEQEARRRGVDAFLYKPQPLKKLAEIIAGLLGN